MKIKILRIWKTHDKLKNQIEYPEAAVVRMGYGFDKEKDDGKKVVNSYDAICLCCDKFAVKKLWNKAGINTPMGYEYKEGRFISFAGDKLSQPQFLKKTKLAKLRENRRYGRGMMLISTDKELNDFISISLTNGVMDDYYFEDFYNYFREFRVHCSSLGIVHVAQKIREKEHPDTEVFDSNHIDFTTNFADWKFPFKRIEKECVKALKLIELDIAGFDVRVNKTGFSFKLIEANSAPSLSETSAEKYIKHIPKLLDYKYAT